MPVEQDRRLSCMGQQEIHAIQCLNNLNLDYDPIALIVALRKTYILDEQSFRNIRDMWRHKCPIKDILNAIIKTVISTCSLNQLIKALYDTGFQDLAGILYMSYLQCKHNKINHIKRSYPNSRTRVSNYFSQMKELVQDQAFKDVFSILCKNLINQIAETKDDIKKMHLCDKFVALKAVEMDSVTNTTSVVTISHKGYQDIKQIINKTSNEALSNVILHSRYAIALSTTYSFEEAASCMRNARVHSDLVGPGVEVTDMIYKSIVIDLTILEDDPQNESFRKSILYKAEEGLWTLSEQEDETRLFWTKAFLIRMAYAYLGIGKSCRIIKIYAPTLESIVQAEKILSNKCLQIQKLEHRRKMLVHVARARIFEFKGEYESALDHIGQAKTLAENGKYAAEIEIIEYRKFLLSQLQIEEQVEISADRLCLDRQLSLNLSSFENISGSSYESNNNESVTDVGLLNENYTDDEETDAKKLLLDEINPENPHSPIPPFVSENMANNDSFPSLEHLHVSSFEIVSSANQNGPNQIHFVNTLEEDEGQSFPSLEHLHPSSLENH